MAVTNSGAAKVTLPTDRQILITREFDAPKHLVYRAWTTPELVKRRWSANRGARDRPRRAHRLDRGLRGHPRRGRPCGAEHDHAHRVDGRTTLAVLAEYPTKEGRDAVIESGVEDGLQDALDLLEQVAASLR